jgi:hypothetical protein
MNGWMGLPRGDQAAEAGDIPARRSAVTKKIHRDVRMTQYAIFCAEVGLAGGHISSKAVETFLAPGEAWEGRRETAIDRTRNPS